MTLFRVRKNIESVLLHHTHPLLLSFLFYILSLFSLSIEGELLTNAFNVSQQVKVTIKLLRQRMRERERASIIFLPHSPCTEIKKKNVRQSESKEKRQDKFLLVQ